MRDDPSIDNETLLHTLGHSVDRLRDVVAGLDDEQLTSPAYPSAWSIADVLSHLGSGAVIMTRRLDDAFAGQPFPDDFSSGVWDTWNAKAPRAKADDALVTDRAFLDRALASTADERSSFQVSFGSLVRDFAQVVGMRLNEHTLHSWDIEVALDPTATLAAESTAIVVDQLELTARYTGKPTDAPRVVVVATTAPERRFEIRTGPDGTTFAPTTGDEAPDLTLPAEALVRLIYGRLDAAHAPTIDGDADLLDVLRRAYPGP
jgi:uncharacterized protein (TIGR03083 family)